MATNTKAKNRAGIKTTGACTVVVEGTITRAANTTQYAAGDVIAGSADENIEFTNCAAAEYGSGTIVSAVMILDSAEVTAPDVELWLFDTEPTDMEDNEAFDPSDAEMLTLVGVIPFSTQYIGSGNSMFHGDTGVFGFAVQDTTTPMSLWGVAVERGTYTPVSGEVFTFRLVIEQD